MNSLNRLLTAIVLCLIAHTAAAQCVVAASPAAAPARATGELIKTAAASTRDTPAARKLPLPAQPRADDDEQPRRAGPAMLLAAVAVMSAIALRRGVSGT